MSTTQGEQNRLFEWYHAIIGEPDRDIDVYLGFALFFGAVALGVTALVSAVVSGSASGETFAWRKLGFMLGMVAVPTALASIVVLLPVDRRGLVGAVVGTGLCLAAVAWFSQVYPYNWATGAGPQYSTEVILTYGVGIAVSLGSTGAALVAYHVARVQRPHPSEIEATDTEESGETISDEQIQRDIEQSMAEVDITWGGIKRTDNTSLELTDGDESIDASGMQLEVDRVRSESSVDAQVDGLKALKGGEKKTHRSETNVNEQTQQLQELKQRREEDPETEQQAGLARLSAWMSGIFGR